MPKLYSSNHIIKILTQQGFICISQKGSRKLGNPTLTVIVPADRKEILVGTFKSILKQSELQAEEFNK